MKIVKDDSKKTQFDFADLEPGHAFEFGGNYYMKIDEVDRCGNAVKLDNGAWFVFKNTEVVRLINATVVIKEL